MMKLKENTIVLIFTMRFGSSPERKGKCVMASDICRGLCYKHKSCRDSAVHIYIRDNYDMTGGGNGESAHISAAAKHRFQWIEDGLSAEQARLARV